MFQDEQDKAKYYIQIHTFIFNKSLAQQTVAVKNRIRDSIGKRFIFKFQPKHPRLYLLIRSTSCIHAVVSILQHPVNPVRFF